MQQPNPSTEPIKPDLKHDNMEYAASTDGDDVLDADNISALDFEEEEITAEELELLSDDDAGELASALKIAEKDSLSDEDNFLAETEVEELSELAADSAEAGDDKEEI